MGEPSKPLSCHTAALKAKLDKLEASLRRPLRVRDSRQVLPRLELALATLELHKHRIGR